MILFLALLGVVYYADKWRDQCVAGQNRNVRQTATRRWQR